LGFEGKLDRLECLIERGEGRGRGKRERGEEKDTRESRNKTGRGWFGIIKQSPIFLYRSFQRPSGTLNPTSGISGAASGRIFLVPGTPGIPGICGVSESGCSGVCEVGGLDVWSVYDFENFFEGEVRATPGFVWRKLEGEEREGRGIRGRGERDERAERDWRDVRGDERNEKREGKEGRERETDERAERDRGMEGLRI
jgi:hypothetical protein